MALPALLLLLGLYLSLASDRWAALLHRLPAPLRLGLVAALLIPYLLVRPPAATPGWLVDGAWLLAYLLLPALLRLAKPGGRPLDAFDLACVLLVWWPLEFNLLPDVRLQLSPSLALPLPDLMGVCLLLWLFRVIRPLPALGYGFRLGWRDLGWALAGALAFLALAVPLALLTGFARPGLSDQAGQWLALAPALFLLVALPEELLFRGVIQNLIEQRFGRSLPTLAAAALVFGLAHLNNATAYHPVPNLAFAGFASLAGLAYGWVWWRSGRVLAVAIAHALVNLVWLLLLDG